MSWREKKIEHTGILFLEAPMSLSFVVTRLLSCNIKKTKKNQENLWMPVLHKYSD